MWPLYLASFIYIKHILLCMHTTFCLSIHLLMDTWVISIFLAIVNNTAVNEYSCIVFECLLSVIYYGIL